MKIVKSIIAIRSHSHKKSALLFTLMLIIIFANASEAKQDKNNDKFEY